MSEHEAFDNSTAIVVHGDELAKVETVDLALNDNDIEKVS